MGDRRKRAKGNIWGALAFLFCSVGIVLLLQEASTEGESAVHIIENWQREEVSGGKSDALEAVPSRMDGETFAHMEVHFIDVGQSDCTLIKNGDYAMLIDAGDNSMGTTVQNYLQKQGVEKLDFLVLTHTDADHIGGADVVITKFAIDTVFMGDYAKDNATYRDVLDALEYKNLFWSTPRVGENYTLGDANFTIIAPNGNYDTPNDSSIGLIVEKGSVRFAFTGDAEKEAEAGIVGNGMDLSATVYKVGHHGSSSSSSAELLDAIEPAYAVISCGRDNSYGYPHREVMTSLQERGIEIFRTDEHGSIVADCDGEKILWRVEQTEEP